jgi:hypothetical protein
MALDGTYAGLQASVARWLDRSDLAADIPDFITLGEARLNDRLRLAGNEAAATLHLSQLTINSDLLLTDEDGNVLTDEQTAALLGGDATDVVMASGGEGSVLSIAALPADFLEMRRLIANTSPKRVLKRAAPGWATQRYDGFAGIPDVYTIVGSNLTVYPSTTADLSLTYYAKLPALSAGNTSNWLLTRYPNMYLYAALLEAAPMLYDDTRALLWKAALDEAIDNAKVSDVGTRFSNGTMRLSGPTP